MIKVGDLVEIIPVKKRSKFQIQAKWRRYLKKSGIVTAEQIRVKGRYRRFYWVHFPELNLGTWFAHVFIQPLYEEK